MKSTGFDDFFVVEAEGFSGGIWLLWHKHWGSLEVLKSHRQFVHTRVTLNAGGPKMLITFTYGSPNVTLRDVLWRELRTIAGSVTESWAVVRDFNSYLCASDKIGGGPPNLVSMNKFRDRIEDCSLSDLGYKGPPFTWEGRGVRKRIDWALGNTPWVQTFPQVSVFHLPRLKSDHNLILIKLFEAPGDNLQRPFHFLASWLTHADFPRVVDGAWKDNMA
ncbi:uncharacterized protein LOC130736869 [Lotus japonicus]|uniref:uncharacterized protein LOC130736869 n=1 Tax=Lotus japonicus TaxID=34305 RepID=UPI0025879D43|nr:uncharacterized protein LOC130736869 [Lotus japonicus]